MRYAPFVRWLLSHLMLSVSVLAVSRVQAEQKPIPLHMAAALTGVAASFGDMERKGAMLAVEHINATGGIRGATLALIVEDTKASNREAITVFQKLVSYHRARVIIGPTWLDSFQGVLPLVDRSGVFVLAPSAAVPAFKRSAAEHPLVYSVWFNIDREIETLLEHLKQSDLRRVAIVTDDDNFFQTVRQRFLKHAPRYDVFVESDTATALTPQDFRTLAAKLRRMNPDGIVFGFGSEQNLFNFLKAKKELFSDARLFGTDYLDGFSKDPKFRELLEGTHYVAPTNASSDFQKDFKKRFGVEPVLSAGPAYDCVMLLAAALRSGQSEPEAIRAFLMSREFDLVSMGKTSFTEDGQVKNSLFRIKLIASENRAKTVE